MLASNSRNSPNAKSENAVEATSRVECGREAPPQFIDHPIVAAVLDELQSRSSFGRSFRAGIFSDWPLFASSNVQGVVFERNTGWRSLQRGRRSLGTVVGPEMGVDLRRCAGSSASTG